MNVYSNLLNMNNIPLNEFLNNFTNQLDQQLPLATKNGNKKIQFRFFPKNGVACRVVELLKKEKIIEAPPLATMKGTFLLPPLDHQLEDTIKDCYYLVTFAPINLENWIQKNLSVSNKTLEKIQPLPTGVSWNEEECTLTFPNKKPTKLAKGSIYAILFKIYMKKHGIFIPHLEIKKEDQRFTPEKISSTINTMKKGVFKNNNRITFETKVEGAYRLLIQ